MKVFVSLAVASMALYTGSAARANLLINGSLESAIPAVQPDNLVYASPVTTPTALTGWTIDSGTIDIVPNSYFRSSDGNWSVDMVGTPGIGSISQQVATVALNEYTLTFDLSFNPERGITLNERSATKILRVEAIGADGTTVLEFEDYLGTRGSRTNSNMQYSERTFTFTADGAFTTIRLRAMPPLFLPAGATPETIYTGPVVDNLDLVLGGGGVIPEPASIGILGAAATMLLIRRRRPQT